MKFKIPHTLVIIISLMILAIIGTHLIPGGEFDRKAQYIETLKSERMLIVKDSYKPVASQPKGVLEVFTGPMKGMQEHYSLSIIFFILLIGGVFGIITSTRAVDAALMSLIEKLKGSEILVIPAVMISFSLGGATFGMCEETIPFVAMMVPVSLMLGYDSLTGIAMVYVASSIGFATAFLNPFTVGIAQGIAGLAPFSGLPFRVGLWIFFTILSVGWVMRYASKIKKNPELSLCYEEDRERKKVIEEELKEGVPLTVGRVFVLILIVIAFALIIYGAINLGWYIEEMIAVFLGLGFLAGIVHPLRKSDRSAILALIFSLVGAAIAYKTGKSEGIVFGLIFSGFLVCAWIRGLDFSELAEWFSKGVCEIASVAIIVGFAKTVIIILEESKVMDTLLFYAANLAKDFSGEISAVGMMMFHAVFNFFVPSGSGQAAMTIPIMAPLADVVGISRQTAVLAYQFGDGFNNLIIPTSCVTIAVLAVGKVKWDKWLRWMIPFQLTLLGFGALALMISVWIGWS